MALKWRITRNDVERENRRLQAEIAVLRRDNEDLRYAATSWRRLYDIAIAQAPGRRVFTSGDACAADDVKIVRQ